MIQGELLLTDALHIMWQPFPWNKLAEENERALAPTIWGTSTSRAWFDFGIFSWLGNCKHNMWQASHLQHSRHGKRSPDCPRGTEKADGGWVGPHHSEEQWPRNKRSTWQIWFSLLRKLPENPGTTKGLGWTVTEGAFQTHPYCVHFFWIMYDNGIFFSLLWGFTTQFQLFDHLAKGTPNKNSFDIDSKLDLLLKKIPGRQIHSNNVPTPLFHKKCIFLNITGQTWYIYCSHFYS